MTALSPAPPEPLVFQPEASRSLQRGINLIAEAIKPTLGPIPRAIAVSQALENKAPELLDKGGLIARRITDLPDRDADMGAMLLRQMLWQLYEDCGDGTAAAAVIFQSVYNEGLKYIAAGGNAMRLRQRLEEGLTIALQALASMQKPIVGREQLAQLAECVCHDRELAQKLGEIFDFIGEHGQLDVRRGHTRTIQRDYMKGMYWKRGAVARAMLRGGKEPDRIVMNEAAILLSDLDIENPADLLPLITVLMRAGAKSLLLVGEKFSEAVINFILSNKNPEQFRIVAVKTPGLSESQRRAHLSDMAVITGAIPLVKAAGDRLASALERPQNRDGAAPSPAPRPSCFGQAKQVWVERAMFGLVSDREDQEALTEHLADLLEQLEYAIDKDAQAFLRERIGKILGGVAILRIGDAVPARMDSRIAIAKETAKSLRRALRDGIVPGGGIAYFACRDALQQRLDLPEQNDMNDLNDLNELNEDSAGRAARRILLHALEQPLRAICANGGFDSAKVAELAGMPQDQGIDIRSGAVVNMIDAGIFDVASVAAAALRGAVSSAALALTIDVLLHHQHPPAASSP